MDFLHFMPVVNNLPLFYRCLDSAKPLWPHTVVIDNTPERVSVDRNIRYLTRPPVPLYMYQTMNLMVSLTKTMGYKLFSFQHADCELTPEIATAWRGLLQQPLTWGAIQTNYDTLSAYNMACVETVGLWDTNFVTYWGDVDWFRRAQLAGREIVKTTLNPVHHGEQNTRGSDPWRKAMHGPLFAAQEEYYRLKWGGGFGDETFDMPFNKK